MKNNALLKVISFLLLVAVLTATFAGCAKQDPSDPVSTTTQPSTADNSQPTQDFIDYAASVKLDWNSKTAKEEVTVKNFVDGDTTHFNVSHKVNDSGLLKARYLAINTPESTGKIEEWGKKASNFTKEKLSAATSIVVESDDENWNVDSTGGRYLVWVWYKTADMEDYRNLNIEILQEGLARASSSANNIYGSVCVAAINQAKAAKLNVYSGQKDPDFYYGAAVELDLKELRANIEEYEGTSVAFNAIVVQDSNSTVYVEAYDAENDMYYGMTVYYGYNLSAGGLEILSVGNEVRIVGKVQAYNGSWQISGLSYRAMRPDDPSNIQVLSSGHEGAFRLTDPATFANGKVEIVTEEGTTSYPCTVGDG